ncbi:hypothetical protein [Methylobacterium trifolii]|uniref:Uncharacterized protein n=1 Tax=Methylobacterium trifolii TaxID=1003092 RepID=A0ABQ4TWC0_9HYPH|nr:hypothetical protein [Methylobacterium trifolii]GJE59545.1 hypothetical protein MPOCJGCO_1641 [Methylobacterium trifolii]
MDEVLGMVGAALLWLARAAVRLVVEVVAALAVEALDWCLSWLWRRRKRHADPGHGGAGDEARH